MSSSRWCKLASRISSVGRRDSLPRNRVRARETLSREIIYYTTSCTLVLIAQSPSLRSRIEKGGHHAVPKHCELTDVDNHAFLPDRLGVGLTGEHRGSAPELVRHPPDALVQSEVKACPGVAHRR